MYPPDHARLAGSGGQEEVATATPGTVPLKEAKRRLERSRRRTQRRQASQAGTTTDATKVSKKEDEKKKEEKGAQPAAEESGPIKLAMAGISFEQTAPAPASRLAFSAEVLGSMPILAESALKALVTSLAQEVIPSKFEPKTPETMLAKFSDEHGPSAKVSRKVQLEAEISRCHTIEATCGDGPDMAGILSATLKQRTAAEGALAKMAKDTPSQLSECKDLEETLASFELAAQARLDREARGAEKTAERLQDRKRHLEAMEAEFVILKRELAILEKGNAGRYMERAALAARSDEQVRDLVRRKLATLRTAAALPTVLPAAAGPSTVAAIPSGALALVGGVPPMSVDEHTRLLDQQRARIVELEALVQRSATMSIAEFEKRFDDITPEQLPTLTLPPPEDAVAYGALLSTLQNWSWAGGAHAFQWRALQAVAGTVEKAMEIVKQATGDQWVKFYPTPPDELDVVPKQLALFALHTLTSLRIVYADSQVKEVKELGMEGLEAVRDSGKRLRTE